MSGAPRSGGRRRSAPRRSTVPLGAAAVLVALALVASCSQNLPSAHPTPATTAGVVPGPLSSGRASSGPTATPTGPTTPAVPSAAPTSAGPATAGPATQAPQADLQRFYSQHVSWTACHGVAQCATITVPLDYADLAKGTITLSLYRVRATGPGTRAGSVVFNPGGPGVSALPYILGAAHNVIDPAVLARYDAVGFDPRGVGASTPVSCLGTAGLDALVNADPAPTTPAAIAHTDAVSRSLADACAARSARILPYLGTDETDRDLDVIRALLGQTRLDYLGKSYGTYIGSTYAQLFPGRVGRFVLDGVLDPTLDTDAVDLGQAGGFQTALTAFLTAWVATGSCPLGSTVPAAQTRLITLLDRLRAHPLATGESRPLTLGAAATGVLYPLYSKSLWPELQAALTELVAGDGSFLREVADVATDRGPTAYEDNSTEAFWATSCLDRGFSDGDARIEAMVATFDRVSPVFGAYLAWSSLPCRYWHVPPNPAPGPIRAAGAPAILVIGTTRDPATPYAWAKSLATQLDSGVFLGRVGDGHTAYLTGNRCIDVTVDAYLLTGSTPPDGTVCPDPSAAGAAPAAPTASAPAGIGAVAPLG